MPPLAEAVAHARHRGEQPGHRLQPDAVVQLAQLIVQVRIVQRVHAARTGQRCAQRGGIAQPADRRQRALAVADELPARRRPWPARVPFGAGDRHRQRIGRQRGRRLAQRPRVHQPHVAVVHRRGRRRVEAQRGGRRTQQRRLGHPLDAGRAGHAFAAMRQPVQGFVAGVDRGAAAVPRGRRIAGHVLGVEQIGFAAGGAGHPLPAQVVAGQIAVQQMRVEPVGAGAPVHLAQVHHIAGQPHAGVVVQVAAGVQLAHRAVDRRHARAAGADVGGQLVRIRLIRQRTGVQRGENPFAPMRPDVVEIFAPAELVNQLVLWINRVTRGHAGVHLGQAQQAVAEVGRQPRHRTVERIAAACVVARAHGGEARQRGLAGRRKRGGGVGVGRDHSNRSAWAGWLVRAARRTGLLAGLREPCIC